VSISGPPWLNFEPMQLLNVDFDADPYPYLDTTFHSDEYPYLIRLPKRMQIRILNTASNCGCAAKAFYSCPAIISRRPESQNTSKEPQLNTEEESKIIQARSHITLEKSARNYKPSEE
jgi:hypothetical protein